MGIPCDPIMCFNASDLYPTASTCAIELMLLTQYGCDYESFKHEWVWHSHVIVPMVGSEKVNCSVTQSMYMLHYLLNGALSIFSGGQYDTKVLECSIPGN